MIKVRITILKQTIYQDLIKQYENPIPEHCSMRVGDVFIVDNLSRPEGFCPSAWDTLSPYIDDLLHGKGNFYDGWMKNPMSALLSCDDGFRPMSFLLEAIDE